MAKSSTPVVFLSALRTPFGTFGGKLKDFSPIDLAVTASKAAITRAGVSATDVDQTIFGNVLYTVSDSIYFARHVALKSGCRQETSALTLNRLCGSGFQAVVSGAQEIILGDAKVCLVGGAESMSQAPHVTRGIRWGTPLGRSPALEDTLWEGLTDSYVGLGMAETAENLADRYKLDRGCVDEFALRSQQLSKSAWDSGVFEQEVVPVPIKNPKTGQPEEFSRDEHMRPDTSAEKLAALKPVFRKGGVVTAGNASGIGDGAGAMVIASEKYATDHGLKPLGRLVSWAVAGVDPSIMGIGPVPSSKAALAKAGLSIDDMDLIEVNEAFAAQTCAVEREMSLPRERLNIHGGAIALSHPLAASGARITAHLLHALRAERKRYGLGTACIGGGQGIALVIESIH
ncbi:MAG TPA: acetyl-CoA C-acetyltransferase [Gemmatimonadaceae bacterium]|jgi:acetyl-CoA acetyltransferase family protein|nr:acetyl-CoA C-acetyltransferase [Gemmatimonadaceae bacterium]